MNMASFPVVEQEPDAIWDPERQGWIWGELPITDGVIDGQGCMLQVDIAANLQIFTQPNAEQRAWLEAENARIQAGQQAAQVQQDTDLATLQEWASKDPAVAALLRRLGITEPGP